MFRSTSLALAFVVLLFGGCILPTKVNADQTGCQGQRWCFEAETFAFRLTEGEITIDVLRGSNSDLGGNVGYLIDYILNHHARYFLGWLRPTPSMHPVIFPWNIGLRLKDGEVIWAEKWLDSAGGEPHEFSPGDIKTFTPGLSEQTPGGKSFLMVLAFPDRTPGGKE